MQRQSTSTAPGIATAPRSVVQIPMADGEQTGFPQVSAPASVAVQVPEEEEENNEDTESGNSDDDEDMDDINHTALPKEVVRPNTPTVRPQTADIWKHVSRIAKHDVPDRAMKTECTHARKRHWHSQSTEATIESSSLPREDGISICLKRRQHNLRSRWLV